LPTLPFRPGDQIDIVNVDFVAESIVGIHQKERPNHEIYHLSSGVGSQTFKQLTDALAASKGGRGPTFFPSLEGPFTSVVNRLSRRRGSSIGYGASLLKVFLPYLVWNTVFDNTRICSELGAKPVPFSEYSYPLLRFAREGHFTYNYQDWPSTVKEAV
jgi:nucleoside-diphosphate-sugar epimerase